MKRVQLILGLSLAIFVSSLSASAPAADPAGPKPEEFEKIVSKAIDYLRSKGQADDGSFSKHLGPAVTSLVTTALLKHGRTVQDPMVAKGLKYLEQFIQEDGGIHQKETLYRNYETSLAVICFKEANKDGRYDKVLAKADKFLKGLQWDGSEGADETDPAFGGAGYGKHKRPDLSNTQFFIEALKATGNDENDPAMKKALIFISRCQNLESDQNTTPFAAKVDDGGFYYTPAAGGTSQAGKTPSGGLRSYASMTYAGLKSMIFAGVGPDDKRVKAAFEWAQKNYDLSSNPGMGQSGLYYYYHTFAKALDAMDVDTITDAEGKKHDWRAELTQTLKVRQRPDGSWTNDDSRWLEGDPNLVTGYALLALDYCRPQAKSAKK